MEKNRFTTFVAVTLLLINLLLVSFIFFRNQRPGPPPRPDEIINNRLHFTSDQWEQFKKLKEEHHSAIVACRDSMREQKKMLFDLLKNEPVDVSKKEETIETIAHLQKRIERITFNHFNDLRQLCDAEQKKLFDELIQEMAMALDRSGPPGKRP